jgi:hypothetical protein
MFPILLKILLTACVVVSATVVAERLKPVWGGILTSIPLSSGAAYVMLAMTESPAFLADAALASLVTSIAAYAYLAMFVTLAPHHRAAISVGAAFLTWLALSSVSHAVEWTLAAGALGNVLAYILCRQVTRARMETSASGNRTRPTRKDLILRGLAVGALAAIVSVTARYVGPAVAGTLAVFPVVYVTVAFIVHRRMGGEVAAATMASTVTPLVGVSLAFFAIAALAPALGSVPAMLVALLVTILWPLSLALRHFHSIKVVPA